MGYQYVLGCSPGKSFPQIPLGLRHDPLVHSFRPFRYTRPVIHPSHPLMRFQGVVLVGTDDADSVREGSYHIYSSASRPVKLHISLDRLIG